MATFQMGYSIRWLAAAFSSPSFSSRRFEQSCRISYTVHDTNRKDSYVDTCMYIKEAYFFFRNGKNYLTHQQLGLYYPSRSECWTTYWLLTNESNSAFALIRVMYVWCSGHNDSFSRQSRRTLLERPICREWSQDQWSTTFRKAITHTSTIWFEIRAPATSIF